jgi:Fe2+ or Zn2+ uptake regulation protein
MISLERDIVKKCTNTMACTPAYIASQIRERGFRLTPQRMAILNALHESGGHLLPL